jgi:hypothetical protein
MRHGGSLVASREVVGEPRAFSVVRGDRAGTGRIPIQLFSNQSFLQVSYWCFALEVWRRWSVLADWHVRLSSKVPTRCVFQLIVKVLQEDTLE